MRGRLDNNENSSDYHRAREPQHGHHDGTDDSRSFESNLAAKRRRDQAFHGERVEARQAERFTNHADALNLSKILDDAILSGRPKSIASQKLDDLFFTALLLDIVTHAAASGNKAPAHQETIQSAIDVPQETPFFKFWAKLNKGLAESGYEEAGYGAAKIAFNGGKTPVGSLTFIGKEWDGLRAVPAEPVKYLGGARPIYHGEYREVTGDGTVWHKVKTAGGEPVTYKLPEAALTGARDAKKEAIDKAFR